MSNERIKYIDVARGLGIVLVILGHMDGFTSSTWKQFGAAFHMPVFFVIVGLLSNENLDYYQIEGFYKYVLKKIKQLIVPYLLWALIYSNGLSIETLLRVGYGNNRTIKFAGLWFLPVMFISMVLFYLCLCVINKFIKKYNKKKVAILLVAIIFGISSSLLAVPMSNIGLPWGLDIALTGFSFICFGYFIKSIINKVYEFKNNYTKNIIFFSSSIFIFMIVWVIKDINYPYIQNKYLDRVVMAWGNYGNYGLFIIGALLGSVALILMSMSIEKSKILSFVGKNSLIYMCTNHFAISLVTKVKDYFDWGSTTTIISTIFVSVLVCCICMIICSTIIPMINYFIPNLKGK